MRKNMLVSTCLILFSASFCFARNVQLIDGWYYIGGEKFFVKGLGYETHTRPGQVSWVYSFDPDLIQFDLDRIKQAGFNTLRTWGAMSEDELQLVEQSGLKILFGIWIDPHGDFGDPGFVTTALGHVEEVLKYSSKYHSIIGYLIMNEPLVEDIFNAGAQSTSDLWESVFNLIHEKHPGIPVSFANTIIGDFINMEVFDFAAYNAYIYNPVTLSRSHGYSGYLGFLKQNRAAQMPLIVTEYGLSVSPGNPSEEYGYGGNSLEQQVSGDLFMFRELIDAGAQGGCVFQYHDGWWKGGDEFVHDPVAEEWFGLVGFSSLQDKYGTPRPVWNAYANYQQAIVTEPRNGQIVQGKVPLEFFTTGEAASFSVSENGSVLYSGSLDGTYFQGEFIPVSDKDVRDFELVFDFFNAAGFNLKSEIITILYTESAPVMPEIRLEVLPASLYPGGRNYLKMNVTTNTLFSIEGNTIDYVMHPHIGFDPGVAKSKVMSFTNKKWSYQGFFDIPQGSKVATFGAGFTIRSGKFTKRITEEIILQDGNWADPVVNPEWTAGIRTDEAGGIRSGTELYQNFPNPFNSRTRIQFYLPGPGPAELEICNVVGQRVAFMKKDFNTGGMHEMTWNADSVPAGLYFYRLRFQSVTLSRKWVICN